MTLADLKRGQSGLIKRILVSGQVKNRLLELGFRPGETVELVRSAPLRDPLEFHLSGSHISLRRTDAAWIEIMLTEPGIIDED